MYTLAASTQNPNGKQQSLEDFLHPTTFYLQLRTVQGKLQAVEIDDISEVASMYEPVRLALDSVPRSFAAPTPSADIEFIEDLFMGKVLKVNKNGEVCVFKAATHGNEDQLKREINILQQISEKWEPDHPHRPQIPQFLGLVTSAGQVIGMLEEFVDGMNLHEFDIDDVSSAQRRKWKRQIEQSITQLHQSGIVWGDVKPENVLIDKAACAWLVDFGGSSTDGWVDEDLAETIEGDLQGLYRLVEFLGVRH
ncbi:Protein kinase domain-containing protein [Cladophialophora immunda]|nr:Protein kinase domain-containing protein [Cladophialophora immunda]